MSDTTPQPVPISQARAELGEIINRVRMRAEVAFVSQRGKTHAAIVTAELGEAIEAAGGTEKALRLLRAAAR